MIGFADFPETEVDIPAEPPDRLFSFDSIRLKMARALTALLGVASFRKLKPCVEAGPRDGNARIGKSSGGAICASSTSRLCGSAARPDASSLSPGQVPRRHFRRRYGAPRAFGYVGANGDQTAEDLNMPAGSNTAPRAMLTSMCFSGWQRTIMRFPIRGGSE